MNSCLKTGLTFLDVDSGKILHGDLFWIEDELRIHGIPTSELDRVSKSEPEGKWMMKLSLASSTRADRLWMDDTTVKSRWTDYHNLVIIEVTDTFKEFMERVNDMWVKNHAEDYEWWYD